jgi:hypothetical protein
MPTLRSGVDASTFNAGRDLKEWNALRAVVGLLTACPLLAHCVPSTQVESS